MRIEELLRHSDDPQGSIKDMQRQVTDSGLFPGWELDTSSPSQFCADLTANLEDLVGNWQAPLKPLNLYESPEELLGEVLPAP